MILSFKEIQMAIVLLNALAEDYDRWEKMVRLLESGDPERYIETALFVLATSRQSNETAVLDCVLDLLKVPSCTGETLRLNDPNYYSRDWAHCLWYSMTADKKFNTESYLDTVVYMNAKGFVDYDYREVENYYNRMYLKQCN